ncbi:MAG: universal stress protein [Nitrospiraceae bacterium]|nr:universal stress protein [Nitrospiraceae bacterium]
MKIERILFATDFSEGSDHALPYAVDMARQYNSKLYLVHVIYDVAKTAGWYVPHVSIDEIYRDMERSARAELEKIYIDEMRGFKDIEHVVLKGIPYEEITRFAAEQQVDLIILGTHGRKGIDRMLFGSTAEQVVRTSPCPVLSVRLPQHNKNK